MKNLLSTLAALSCATLVHTQTADTLVLQGRSFLVAKDLTNAHARFAAAVQAGPAHPSANALLGSTRLLALAHQPATQAMLDRLGFALTNRSLYHWTAGLRTDTNGVPIPPNDFDAMEGMAFVRTNFLPEVTRAIGNFDRITDRSFVLALASNETTVAEVTVDYGDVAMLRSLLHALEAFVYWLNSYNFSAQLSALDRLHTQGELTLPGLLDRYPQLLTYATTADLLAAQASLRAGVTDYLLASEFIRQRPTNLTRLFNYDPDMAQSEAEFRTRLAEFRDSLDRPVTLSGITNGTNRITVQLGNLLSPATVLRPLLPHFVADGFVLGSLPDPTFNGVVWGFTRAEVEQAWAGGFTAYPSLQMWRSGAATVSLALQVLPGEVYAVMRSTNLTQWAELHVVQASNSTETIELTVTPGETAQFFKTVAAGPPPQMVWIPPAVFTMGSPANESDRNDDEGPQTRVTISRGFGLGKYEVTQREYMAVMGTNPSYFIGDLDRPVERVTWSEATNYCGKLTQRERAAGRLPSGYEYRLPTEAEWEYACRAGTTTRFPWGDDPGYSQLGAYAWYWGNSYTANKPAGVSDEISGRFFTTHRVGTRLPNPWGSHDLHGSVWEWTSDWYARSLPGGSVTDPKGPSAGSERVFRGGAYFSNTWMCRSAHRSGNSPESRLSYVGFRLALAAVP